MRERGSHGAVYSACTRLCRWPQSATTRRDKHTPPPRRGRRSGPQSERQTRHFGIARFHETAKTAGARHVVPRAPLAWRRRRTRAKPTTTTGAPPNSPMRLEAAFRGSAVCALCSVPRLLGARRGAVGAWPCARRLRCARRCPPAPPPRLSRARPRAARKPRASTSAFNAPTSAPCADVSSPPAPCGATASSRSSPT